MAKNKNTVESIGTAIATATAPAGISLKHFRIHPENVKMREKQAISEDEKETYEKKNKALGLSLRARWRESEPLVYVIGLDNLGDPAKDEAYIINGQRRVRAACMLDENKAPYLPDSFIPPQVRSTARGETEVLTEINTYNTLNGDAEKVDPPLYARLALACKVLPAGDKDIAAWRPVPTPTVLKLAGVDASNAAARETARAILSMFQYLRTYRPELEIPEFTASNVNTMPDIRRALTGRASEKDGYPGGVLTRITGKGDAAVSPDSIRKAAEDFVEGLRTNWKGIVKTEAQKAEEERLRKEKAEKDALAARLSATTSPLHRALLTDAKTVPQEVIQASDAIFAAPADVQKTLADFLDRYKTCTPEERAEYDTRLKSLTAPISTKKKK